MKKTMLVILMPLVLISSQAFGQTDISSPLRVVEFSPDGSLLIIGSGNDKKAGDLVAWETSTGKELWRLSDEAGFSSAAFIPDGSQLVVGRFDPEVRIIDPKTSKTMRSFTGHQSAVRTLDVAKDGRRIVTGSFDNTVKVWDTDKLQEQTSIQGTGESIYNVKFSPDCRLLAIAQYGKYDVRFYDLVRNHMVLETPSFRSLVAKTTFTPDGRYAYIASWGGDSELIDTKELRRVKQYPAMGRVQAGAFSPDQRHLAIARNTSIQVFPFLQSPNAETREQVANLVSLLESDDYPTRLRATKELTAIGSAAETQLSEAAKSTLLETRWRAQTLLDRLASTENAIVLDEHKTRLECLIFSPDGKLLASGDRGGTVLLWNADDWKLVRRLSLWPDEKTGTK